MLAAQGRVAASPDDVHPLLIGATIPDITLTDVDYQSVELLQVVRQKPAIIIYYRGGWCPFCNRQLSQLQGLQPKLLEMGYQIIAISSDRPSNLRKSLNKRDLTYTLLSDSAMVGARQFGLAWKMSDRQVMSYKLLMMDVEKGAGLDHHIVPVPGVFIVDRKGVVQFQYVNPNHRVRLNAEVLETAARTALK